MKSIKLNTKKYHKFDTLKEAYSYIEYYIDDLERMKLGLMPNGKYIWIDMWSIEFGEEEIEIVSDYKEIKEELEKGFIIGENRTGKDTKEIFLFLSKLGFTFSNGDSLLKKEDTYLSFAICFDKSRKGIQWTKDVISGSLKTFPLYSGREFITKFMFPANSHYTSPIETQENKIWMVKSDIWNKINGAIIRHPSKEKAMEEAARLSKINPGIRFYVLESIDSVYTPSPIEKLAERIYDSIREFTDEFNESVIRSKIEKIFEESVIRSKIEKIFED